jgi:hypothetical protein
MQVPTLGEKINGRRVEKWKRGAEEGKRGVKKKKESGGFCNLGPIFSTTFELSSTQKWWNSTTFELNSTTFELAVVLKLVPNFVF